MTEEDYPTIAHRAENISRLNVCSIFPCFGHMLCYPPKIRMLDDTQKKGKSQTLTRETQNLQDEMITYLLRPCSWIEPDHNKRITFFVA